MIIGIDPGTTKSGVVTLRDDGTISFAEVMENEDLLRQVQSLCVSAILHTTIACEWIEHMGMPSVGASIFETCRWFGRFEQAAIERGCQFVTVTRRQVRLHLCGSMRAGDPNVRQAIIDRYPATGGGKRPQVGTKKKPGPLYGVSTHMWSALAVALTYADGGAE